MSKDAPAPDAAPKKKGKLKGILMMLIMAIVFIGGGVGAGLYAAGTGLVGGKHAEEKPEDPNAPKLVAKEGAEGEGHGEGGEKPSLPIGLESEQSPDPTKYKATYYTFEQPFTANLRDSDSFAQIGLSASTYYDAKVVDNLKNNETPIRSAILMAISQQDSFSISTPEGKLALQKALKDTINDVLRKQEGFGGIDNVYFTSLVVQ
jgi:flagellar FliL protein